MSNEWENWAKYEGAALSFTKPLDLNYEYKVMRRKVKTERDEFIEKARVSVFNSPLFGSNINIFLAGLYDAGARFK